MYQSLMLVLYTADSNNLHLKLWDTGSVLLDTVDIDLDNEVGPIFLCAYIGYMKDNRRYHIKSTKTICMILSS